MKKVLFLLNMFILTTATSCKDKNIVENLDSKCNNACKVIFKIDERTEFLRTIFNLAVIDDLPEDLQACETDYLKRVNGQFLQHRNHPLINWIYDNESIGIDFSTIGLMFKDFEHFEFDERYSEELKFYGLTRNTVDTLIPLMKDFYATTEFKKFFKSNEHYYTNAISKLESQVSEEKLFDKVLDFYQSRQEDLELIVFVELTNNANNKAVSFYDGYNPKRRAIILANICDLPSEPTGKNEIMELENHIRGQIYHEASHLFTTELLENHIGDLNQYKSMCEDCGDMEIKDKIDHLIVYPLQELISYRTFGKDDGHNFYLNKCQDVRKDIYRKLSAYQPQDGIPFAQTYIACMNLIKQSASEE